MDTSEVLMRSFEDAGVEYVFGLPGSVVMNTIDKLSQLDMTFISTRHEQVATTMADGYARVTGKPGITLAHVGPGAANQIVGMAAAHRDASPVIAVTGNEDRGRLGRDIWHEWDVLGVFDRFTKWSTRIERGTDTARIARQSLVKSVAGRPGPVHVDLPKDVAREDASYSETERTFYDAHDLQFPFARPEPGRDRIDAVVERLEASIQPLLLVGGGAIRSRAGTAVRAIAEALDVPVATSMSGRGVIPETHNLSLGMVGNRGTDAANRALGAADCVVAIGARFSALTTQNWSLLDENATLVQVDIHPEEFASQYPIDIAVQADARRFTESLVDRLATKSISGGWPNDDHRAYTALVDEELDAFFDVVESEAIDPRHLFKVLQRELDSDAITTTGGGVHAAFNVKRRAADPFSHLGTVSFGAMGYGFPLALGAKLGAPDRQTVCVEGDGGFMMVIQDLETAVRYDIDVKVLVYNNYSHGTQKLRQLEFFDERYLGTDVGNPPFDAVAEEFGATGFRVEDPAKLQTTIRAWLEADGPAVLDVIADPTVWPSTDSIAQI